MNNYKLNDILPKLQTPCIVRNALNQIENSNSCLKWTLDNLNVVFKNEKLAFRIGKKESDNRK